MKRARTCSVETAIGPIGLLWTEVGIAGLALPGDGAEAVRARFARIRPDAVANEPDGAAVPAIAGLTTLLRGEPADFHSVPLDLDGVPAFDRRVYDVALAIRRGETMTYGAVASRLGEPGAARAVGAALGRNPIPIIVPCHRVLAAGGRMGGFSAPGGTSTKQRLLAIEGAAPGGQPDLFGRTWRDGARQFEVSAGGSAIPASR